MAKTFCGIDSEGPNLVNFQLSFWRLAVAKYAEIKHNFHESASENEEEEADYTANDFEVDAAVALVLAGTSVSELIGQNVPPEKDSTPNPRTGYKLLFGTLPPHVDSLIKIYDALRHFGPAKHDAIRELDEQSFCDHMTTAQTIWVEVQRKIRGTVGSDFQNDFKLN